MHVSVCLFGMLSDSGNLFPTRNFWWPCQRRQIILWLQNNLANHLEDEWKSDLYSYSSIKRSTHSKYCPYIFHVLMVWVYMRTTDRNFYKKSYIEYSHTYFRVTRLLDLINLYIKYVTGLKMIYYVIYMTYNKTLKYTIYVDGNNFSFKHSASSCIDSIDDRLGRIIA